MEVEVVVVWRCWTVVLCVRWSGVCGPGQSFDNGMVRVDHPAAALLVEDCAVVIVEHVLHLRRYILWQHPKQGV